MRRAIISIVVVTLATSALVWMAAVSRVARHPMVEKVVPPATRMQTSAAAVPGLPESEAMTQLRGVALHAARSTLLTVRGN